MTWSLPSFEGVGQRKQVAGTSEGQSQSIQWMGAFRSQRNCFYIISTTLVVIRKPPSAFQKESYRIFVNWAGQMTLSHFHCLSEFCHPWFTNTRLRRGGFSSTWQKSASQGSEQGTFWHKEPPPSAPSSCQSWGTRFHLVFLTSSGSCWVRRSGM